MYTVAVTGSTGFVGNYIAHYLESRGCRVFRFGRKNKKGILQWDITQGVYKHDIHIDCVVHCAASVNDWESYEVSNRVNVLGTENVLESFSKALKFVYISSASVYNAFSKQVVILENECTGGKLLNNYSKTKLLGEKELKKSKIPCRVIFRPHIIYGPGDTTISPRIKKAIKFGYLPVPGNGKNRISFTHIENLSQAVWQALKVSKKGLAIYNITDKDPIIFSKVLRAVKNLNNLEFKEFYIPQKLSFIVGAILEFLYTICRVKNPPLLTRYIVEQMSSDHIFDISKAKRELHYNPTRNIYHDFLL